MAKIFHIDISYKEEYQLIAENKDEAILMTKNMMQGKAELTMKFKYSAAEIKHPGITYFNEHKDIYPIIIEGNIVIKGKETIGEILRENGDTEY